MTSARYTDLQLDALRELANIGSGTAGTALSSLIGRSIDISVPTADALDLADAVDAAGPGEQLVWAVVVGVDGDLDATALLIVGEEDAATICGFLGVDADSETGRSALEEIGNILVASYIGAFGQMTGFELDLKPPSSAFDMLAAVVASVLASREDALDVAIMLDSELRLDDDEVGLSFMLLPTPEGVDQLLHRIGVGA